jgi:hypothetical protein
MNVNEVRNRPASDWCGNILAFVFTIFVNGLANGVPLGGQTTGEISNKYPSLFTPAGYVFSIWGLIYISLTVFIVWQALPQQRSNKYLAAIRIPFLASCAANGAWIFAWHYDLLALSLILMLTLLCSLIQIYRTLNIGLSTGPVSERWLVHLPFSIYLGWVTVAMIANISALQIDQGWDDTGFNATTWTIIKIAIAAMISATVLFRRQDIAFMLVTVWACTGIAIKHSATPMVSGASSVIALFGLLLIASELLVRSRLRC